MSHPDAMSQPDATSQPLVSQSVAARPVAPRPVPRTLATIDADLHSSRAIRRDAEKELAEVRRRQDELADLEATLLVTIDSRCRLVDHLLDERLRAAAAGTGNLQSSVAASPSRPLASSR